MFRPVEVKVCGLTSEADVALAREAGADFFGFIVYPKSPRAVSLERARALAAEVPEGRSVIVDVETASDALEAYRDAGFGAFQIHCGLETGMATLATWSGLVGPGQLWLAPRIPNDEAFPEIALNFTDNIVVDTFSRERAGGTGQTGDWGRFRDWQASYVGTRFILAGGLAPDNIQAAVAESGAERIDVNSGVETAPGKKDPAKLRELFSILRPG